MQLGTFTTIVPIDYFRLLLLLTVLFLPRSTKAWCDMWVCDTRSYSAKRFQQFIVELRALCRVARASCSWISRIMPLGSYFSGSNSCGILQKRTGGYFCVRWRRNPNVFDLSVGKVRSLPRKVQSGSINALWVWQICQFQRFGKWYWLFPWIKSWASGIECLGAKTIVKFCSRKFRISRLL